QHAPRWREPHQHGPEERAAHAKGLLPARHPRDGLPVQLAGVVPVAGARFGSELGPEILELATLGHALPELADPSSGARGLRAVCGHASLFAFPARKRAAVLQFVKAEAVAELVGGAGQALEFLAAAGVQQIELHGAVR